MSAQRKTYHFFLCHHKRGAGSVARLLKILLLRRSQAFTSFVDCDDLQEREIASFEKAKDIDLFGAHVFFVEKARKRESERSSGEVGGEVVGADWR